MARLADQPSSQTIDTSLAARRLRITVLSGGPGDEREISIKSGERVAAALESLGHDVYRADVSPNALSALNKPVDLIFVALHGSFGEDGQLQAILQERGIQFCGTGASASALAMDKVASKCRFIEAELPTPRFEVVLPDGLSDLAASWSPPVVIKPVAQGSSIDCRLIRHPADLEPALESLAHQYDRSMIEQYIQGPELTVGILGDQALPPIEIRTSREFYDFRAKYLDEDTEFFFDIDLPSSLLEEIQELSLKAHLALGCRDFSRVDWMVEQSTGKPYILEVNTIPGLTDHSLLPKAAGQAGLTFPELCQRIVELACSRSVSE